MFNVHVWHRCVKVVLEKINKKSCDKEKMHNYKNAGKKKKNDNLLEKVAVKLVSSPAHHDSWFGRSLLSKPMV